MRRIIVFVFFICGLLLAQSPGDKPVPVDSISITTISRTQLTMLGNGLYATVYRGASSRATLRIDTVNASGTITNKDVWEMSTGTISYPDIVKIPNSRWIVVSYDSSSTPTIATTQVSTTGSITKSFSDYKKPGGTTTSLVVEHLKDSLVIAIWPEDTHASDAYKGIVYEVNTTSGVLTPKDTVWLSGSGRTASFAAFRRIGISDYFLGFLVGTDAGNNFPKA